MTAPADAALTQLVAALRSRPWLRRFLPPLDEADVATLEARLGPGLPALIRTFYSRLCGGEEDRGYLGILTLDRGVANAARLRLPDAPDTQPPVTLLPIRERDDGPFDAVVCEGPFADTIWLLDGATVAPLAGVDGRPLRSSALLWEALSEAQQAMPPPLDRAATNVDLAGLDLEAFPQLSETPNAVSIALAGNRLTDVPDAVRHMSKLERLELGANQLGHLPAWLGDLPLRWLDVTGNRLHALPPSMRRLDKLEFLAAARNQLEMLSTEGLAALQTLGVANNRIEHIDGAGPPALRTIDLGNNLLTELPGWLGELADLQDLKLAGNPLAALPSSLEGAEFSTIEIGALPSQGASGAQPTWDWAVVFELLGSCKIDWLRIAGSPLQALPDAARSLQRVRRLAIQSAVMETLPEFIGQLASLEELWLDDNRLTTLPSSLARHPRLRGIVLFRNPIARSELDRLRSTMPNVAIDA